MKTPDQYQSDDVNDYRDGVSSSSRFGGIGAGALGPIIGLLFQTKTGRIIGIILIIAFICSGAKFGNIFNSSDGNFGQLGNTYNGIETQDPNGLKRGEAPTDQAAIFVSFVLDDVNNFWYESFRQSGESYKSSKLNIFDGDINSGCGYASKDVGPFYCPRNEQTYIDLSFFDELKNRFGSSGDFAQAYVIAHEIGHHVQNTLGVNAKVEKLIQQGENRNFLSVRTELQADCLAGVWAYSADARGLLDVGDIEEALNAASNIGDDSIAKQSNVEISNEQFTHGTSQQRKHWLQVGYRSGDVQSCDTFNSKI
ncbi:MAG: neutral zinc metallopeptidase [Acidimicrobiia bacterium]